ncbi:MAG: hypothetical protein IT169_19740 [Bryobacterales bacterium]|nr:hypothetical protein [Bryobacterales bacterium]
MKIPELHYVLALSPTMWQWLTENNNSAAVQGLAAMLNVIITIALACLTGWYVLLTHKMLMMQQGQFQSTITARARELTQSRRRLAMLITRFSKILDQLPWEDRDLEKFASMALWNDRDMDMFEEAVLAVGPDSADVAGEFIESVRWLAGENRRLQERDEAAAIIQPDEYRHRLIAAKTKLADVAMLLVGSE